MLKGDGTMDELDELILSVDARRLVFDLANGCTANRRSGGAPCIVMPPPRGQMPQTRGQVGDFAVGELLKSDLVNLFGAAPPQTPVAATMILRRRVPEA
jgi:hypothetical protein